MQQVYKVIITYIWYMGAPPKIVHYLEFAFEMQMHNNLLVMWETLYTIESVRIHSVYKNVNMLSTTQQTWDKTLVNDLKRCTKS